jgi:hypothetical protein
MQVIYLIYIAIIIAGIAAMRALDKDAEVARARKAVSEKSQNLETSIEGRKNSKELAWIFKAVIILLSASILTRKLKLALASFSSLSFLDAEYLSYWQQFLVNIGECLVLIITGFFLTTIGRVIVESFTKN